MPSRFMSPKQFASALAGLLLIAPLAAQQVYRWVDKDGKVHYSDIAPPVGAISTPKLNDNRVEVDKMGFDMKRLTEAAPITLYTAESCKELCDQARNWLRQRNLPFNEMVGRNAQDIETMSRLLGGEARVPSLTVGSKPNLGFDSAAWNAALQAAGYPAR